MLKKQSKNVFTILMILLFAKCVFAGGLVIDSPLPTMPSIVQKKDSLQIFIKAGKSTAKISAVLSTEYFKVPLIISSARFLEGRMLWEIIAKLPADVPGELYSLEVSSSSGADKKERAVNVVEKYKESFSFVHLTDVHCGDKKNERAFENAVEEINLINPEFVLITGDITIECENVGRALMLKNGKKVSDANTGPYANINENTIKQLCLKEYDAFLSRLSKFTVPAYVVPGNHDMAGLYNEHSLKLYESAVGKRYYSFNYGAVHVAGVDNSPMMEATPLLYPDTKDDLDDAQLTWLEEDLKIAQDKKLRISFFHCPIHAKESKFKELLKTYNTDMALFGHLHFNKVLSKTKPLWIQTSALGDGQWDKRGYRLIKIQDGKIASYTYNNDKKAGIEANKVHVECSENDGKSEEAHCTVKNELQEDFKDAKLRFVMPKEASYEAEGGKIAQEVTGEKFKVLYVQFDIPKMQDVKITIRRVKKQFDSFLLTH